MILRKTFRFEASHRLPWHKGKCRRLHGHSWVLNVEVKGDVNYETGFVMDYADISAVVKPLIDDLDHRHLGSWEGIESDNSDWRVPGLALDNPTSENLLFWIGSRLSPSLSWSKISLEETCTSYAELTKLEWLRVTGQIGDNLRLEE